MPALLIINYDVTDPDAYGDYMGPAGPALGIGTDCELVAFDADSESVEGSPGHQTVVLRFESTEKAKAAYDSADYQAIVGTRHGATTNHFAVLINTVS